MGAAHGEDENLFDGLELEVVHVMDDASTADLTVVFEAPGARIEAVMSFGFERVSLAGEIERHAVSIATGLEVRSPGRRFDVGGRALHVQLLGADGDVCRGPLLLFLDGRALPGFRPESRLARLFRRTKKAILPVCILDPAAAPERVREEVRAGLDLSARLLRGDVTPGMTDAALFAP